MSERYRTSRYNVVSFVPTKICRTNAAPSQVLQSLHAISDRCKSRVAHFALVESKLIKITIVFEE